MSYEYSTEYPEDTFPKLFNMLKEIIEDKRKRQEELEKFGSLPNRTEHERATYNFVGESMLERKSLEILHDRLVDVYNKLPLPKDKDY